MIEFWNVVAAAIASFILGLTVHSAGLHDKIFEKLGIKHTKTFMQTVLAELVNLPEILYPTDTLDELIDEYQYGDLTLSEFIYSVVEAFYPYLSTARDHDTALFDKQ